MHRSCARCASPLSPGLFRCGSCGAWNVDDSALVGDVEPQPLSDFLIDGSAPKHDRIATGLCDENFGAGGTVLTSVTLIGALNGAGKSTFAMQWASAIAAARQRPAVLFPVEESAEETCIRAARLGVTNMSDLRPLPTLSRESHVTYLERLDKGLRPTSRGVEYEPACFVLDSISGLCGDDRDLQRHIADMLKRIAVRYRAPFLVLCQLIKSEHFAGAEYIQHAVDAVMMMQLESFDSELAIGEDPRYLLTKKNRFGPARVDTPLLMTPAGLVFDKKEAARRKAEAEKKAARRKHKIKD